ATVVEPRLAITKKLAELTVHATAGTYARDLAQGTEGIPTDILPERATQITASADVELADGLTASESVYRTWRDHLAIEDATRDPASDVLPYASTGIGSSLGVDLLLRLHRDGWFGWVAYSYAHTTRRDRDRAPLHPTPTDQRHTLTAVASLQLHAWRLGA